jgi:hypothetical protein
MRAPALLAALLFGCTTLAAAQPAFADVDPTTRAAAVALFDEGRKLKAEGKLAEACPKLEQSQRMDPGVGTLFHLSDCYERQGRTASAWVGFREVASEAKAAKREEQERVARERAAALEPKLTRLVIEVDPAAPPGIVVRRDGAPVAKELWGSKLPVDPGETRVEASAEGYEAFSSKSRVEGEGQVVTIRIPALTKRAGAQPPLVAPPPATPPPAAPVAPAAPPESEPAPPGAAASGGGSPRGTIGLVVAGVGVVGLGVGTFLGLGAKSTFDDSDPHCDDAGKCDQTGVDLRSDAVDQGNLATIVFIGGGVLAATGVVLWATAPGNDADDAKTGVIPLRVVASPGGLRLDGHF